jgi:hypothetical protein
MSLRFRREITRVLLYGARVFLARAFRSKPARRHASKFVDHSLTKGKVSRLSHIIHG